MPTRASVTIQTASGDASVANLRGPLKARTASGDLLFVDVAGDVQAETVSGDVAIRLAGSAVLAVRTVSGDAIVEDGVIDQFAFTTTSGDLRVTSELGAGPHAIATVSGDAIITARTGIRVAAQTVAGDLRSDLPHLSEGRAGRRSLIVGEGTTAVQFRSVSGDLRVVGPNGAGRATAIPLPPAPPTPPTPPTPPAVPAPPATASAADAGTEPTGDAPAGTDTEAADDPRLDILRALERGDIDVDEATAGLAALDWPERWLIRSTRSSGSSPRAGCPPRRPRPSSTRSRRPGSPGRPGGDEQDPSATPSGPEPGPGSANRPRVLRVEVSEDGRKVVNLRVPLSLGRMALDRIPGISADNVSRIRQALDEGMTGPILVVEDEDDGNGVRLVLE